MKKANNSFAHRKKKIFLICAAILGLMIFSQKTFLQAQPISGRTAYWSDWVSEIPKNTLYVNRGYNQAGAYQTIAEAVSAAGPEDHIQINSENIRVRCGKEEYINTRESTFYPEIMTINKPLTITAGSGTVTIGECVQRPAAGQLIKPEDADVIVSTKAALLSALKNESLKIIYIRDGVRIDLSGVEPQKIRSGVTLVSGRGSGMKSGALLFADRLKENFKYLFLIQNADVRISGLRFRGPSTASDSDSDAHIACFQIINDKEKVEIDNNEFFGWPLAAIDVGQNALDKCSLGQMHIHDNYFHHNLGYKQAWYWSYTMGYGVVLGSAYALIEKNVFDQNRHAIAGNGSCNSGYEARWNVVLDKNGCCQRPGIGGGSHSFDMHRRGSSDSWGPAGEYLMIRENTFLYKGRQAFTIRGRPTEGAFVFDNAFINPRSATLPREAVSQENVSGNLVVKYNEYEVNHQHELAFGDFDGDGKTDVFWADGRNWWYARGGQMVWRRLNGYPNTLKDLAFGDFNGDGKTDVFRSTGGRWQVSWNGTGSWQEINRSGVQLKDLAFGDFNGDGKTDVFRTHTGRKEWLVSYGGKSAWTKIAGSGVPLKSLAFGDFDGDGKTDVFRTHTGRKEWLVSWGAASGWRKINTSGIGLDELVFGDFNGDGKTDVMRDDWRNRWQVSESGTQRWKTWNNEARAPVGKLYFGDFDGNGKTDVFMIKEVNISSSSKIKTTQWLVSWNGKSTWRQLNPDFDGGI